MSFFFSFFFDVSVCVCVCVKIEKRREAFIHLQVARKDSKEILPGASSKDHVDHQEGPRQVESLHLEEPHDAHALRGVVLTPDVKEHEHERSVQHNELKSWEGQGHSQQGACTKQPQVQKLRRLKLEDTLLQCDTVVVDKNDPHQKVPGEPPYDEEARDQTPDLKLREHHTPVEHEVEWIYHPKLHGNSRGHACRCKEPEHPTTEEKKKEDKRVSPKVKSDTKWQGNPVVI